MTLLNWLHITDLHLGLDGSGWLWPRFKNIFQRDVRERIEGIGGVDVVFFTGDLTQAGTKQEFDKLSRELEELWQLFRELGSEPTLCVVPGNHDLRRPNELDPVTRTLTRLWHDDGALRAEFWANASCDYRVQVAARFRPYQDWLNAPPVPLGARRTGLLPGDFSSTVTKGDVRVAVIGLNSAFLQLSGGDFRQKLDLHVSQVNAVCNDDPHPFLSAHTACVLLTHHPPSWLSAASLAHYRNEINPPGRFVAHFSGHLHEGQASEVTEGGGVARRFRQGPSLFGLERWDGGDAERIHGYTAGQYVFDSEGTVEKFWPRLAIKGTHGALRLRPDHTFDLTDDACVVNALAEISYRPTPSPTTSVAPIASAPDIEIPLSDDIQNSAAASLRLSRCPRTVFAATSQHNSIRLEEQSEVEHELRKRHLAWVCADWGVGKDGFIGSLLDRFKAAQITPETFRVNCDEAADTDALLVTCQQQLGISLQEFAVLTSSLPNAFLILDAIHPGVLTSSELPKLRRLLDALVDFSANLRVIATSRQAPMGASFAVVQLRPLESPDVRTYVANHPDAVSGLTDPGTVDALYEHSGGLPMHLDRIMRALRISTLSEVLEAELARASTPENEAETTPKALADAVADLSRSAERGSRRSLWLLKILALLPNGETLERLKHFLPAEPLFPEHALQLSEFALLDIVPLYQSSARVGALGESEHSVPKVLKVPRQVRDHVRTTLSEDERQRILAAGADRLLGPRWREGILKIKRQSSEYRDYIGMGSGNEFWILHALLCDARASNDTTQIRRLL